MIFSRRRGRGAEPAARTADEGAAASQDESVVKAADGEPDTTAGRAEGPDQASQARAGTGVREAARARRRTATPVATASRAEGKAKPGTGRRSAKRGAGTTGPYDVTDAPAGVERLDLGALQIPVVEGVEVRVQADPEGRVQQVMLVAGESALQLGVFAAPRTEPAWEEARSGLRDQLRADGFTSQEVDGEYGVELRAKVRSPEGVVDLRFVGVNGPRWLIRAVYQGAAARDAAAAGPLGECLRELVVVRGDQAMPAFEALPLKLPREVTEQAQRQGGDAAGDGAVAPGDAAASADDAAQADDAGAGDAGRERRSARRGAGRSNPRRT